MSNDVHHFLLVRLQGFFLCQPCIRLPDEEVGVVIQVGRKTTLFEKVVVQPMTFLHANLVCGNLMLDPPSEFTSLARSISSSLFGKGLVFSHFGDSSPTFADA